MVKTGRIIKKKITKTEREISQILKSQIPLTFGVVKKKLGRDRHMYWTHASVDYEANSFLPLLPGHETIMREWFAPSALS